MDFAKLERKMCDFINERLSLAKAKGVVLGLSGGLDSAIVATVCHRAFLGAQNDGEMGQGGENLAQNGANSALNTENLGSNAENSANSSENSRQNAENSILIDKNSAPNSEKKGILALIMPTKNSNKEHLKDALALCEALKIEHKIIEIQPILDAFLNACESPDRLRLGNLAARVRMSLLYDYSAAKGYLVAGTSNKSELMLGYGTIYGDLACAFNPIGELYKSELYEFARHLGLASCFIDKAPSADLYEGQSDEGELGFKYAQIDELLKALKRADTATAASADKRLLEMVQNRIQNNAFKRAMPAIFKDF